VEPRLAVENALNQKFERAPQKPVATCCGIRAMGERYRNTLEGAKVSAAADHPRTESPPVRRA
jgi:hypothetical protein